jgi:hypothetical protein
MVFLIKTNGYQKNMWHKQECDQYGCDYKGGLVYIFGPCLGMVGYSL